MKNYKTVPTRPIGDRVLIGGHLLEIQDSPSCDDCYFNKSIDCREQTHLKKTGFCGSQYRKDGLSVIFKEVKQ